MSFTTTNKYYFVPLLNLKHFSVKIGLIYSLQNLSKIDSNNGPVLIGELLVVKVVKKMCSGIYCWTKTVRNLTEALALSSMFFTS